ncbi:CD1375 family protein [Methanobrevibacter sp.]|uniref:CD1375 family protein n=1 Tax=Methanobrevibacter sp. TaxID=66852 RepID=UPI00386D1DA6
MKNKLIILSQTLYELRCKSEQLEQNNQALEAKVAENEENLVFAMMACTELYEMLLSDVNVYDYDYGKDVVVKMASAMVKVYVNLVKRGLKTLDEVPERLRAEVEAELEGDE